MKTRYWLAFVATVLAGLTLLLASSLPSHASVSVPTATLTPASTRTPGMAPDSMLTGCKPH